MMKDFMNIILGVVGIALEIMAIVVYKAWVITGNVFYVAMGKCMMALVFCIIVYLVTGGFQRARE